MAHRAGSPAIGPPGASRSRKAILVVDDEPDMLSLLCAVLRANRLDADVKGVATPDAALQGFLQDGVDVLVTDYMMPGMNGLDLARRFRDRHPGLPIILLTAYADAPVQNEAFVNRVNVFMKKPIDPKEFVNEVRRALMAT